MSKKGKKGYVKGSGLAASVVGKKTAKKQKAPLISPHERFLDKALAEAISGDTIVLTGLSKEERWKALYEA